MNQLWHGALGRADTSQPMICRSSDSLQAPIESLVALRLLDLPTKGRDFSAKAPQAPVRPYDPIMNLNITSQSPLCDPSEKVFNSEDMGRLHGEYG